jgi:alpha-N-arabinofuranosidase
MMKKIIAIILLMIASKSFSQQLQYTNPILAGFYPDPSICKVGNDYYLTTSTFSYYPGLPIFHSKDLVNWKQIGNAMNRPEQLNLDGAGVSRGLFAPTIRYRNGLFYIVCTLIDKGGNFIITAKNPAGPWSNPVWLKEVNGIDPSIFFDEDDNRTYIVYNSIPPANKSLYDGHRTIRLREIDKDYKPIGEEKILINGGTDITKHPVWIEAPHIFKKDNWYYLICAEGGTGYNHSEVVFRTKSLNEPFVSYQNNPILTQRHLDTARKNPITTTGHADFVETNDGKWFAVFLGCRPYEGDYYNIGRETFMLPVTWKDGWPHILEGKEEVPYYVNVPLKNIKKAANNFSGNYFFRDEFDNKIIDDRFLFLRTPKTNWYDLNEKKGSLSIKLLPQTCTQKDNPAFIGFRQAHLKCYTSTSLNFTATNENEKAGLTIFQSEHNYYFLCKSIQNNQPVVQLYKSTSTDSLQLLASQSLINPSQSLQLKIVSSGDKYAFYYSIQKNNWILLKDYVDGKFLSTKVAGGFVGSVFAMYATSNNQSSNNKAIYDWFEYKGDDDVFKK